ncbi:MAG: GAF domain-containing protein, partial [candidate division Zixibacteria bacterium]|nr:GAF domain-containing protein [candidate division Zixibacteria bacterium]
PQVGSAKAGVSLKKESSQKNFVLAGSSLKLNFESASPAINEDSPLAVFVKDANRAIAVEVLVKLDDGHNHDKEERDILKQFREGLVLPLMNRGQLNGLLFVGRKSDDGQNTFTTDDEEFLSILSSQIAVAVENARLHEAEKKALVDLQTAQEQLVHSERLAVLGEMSAKIAHEINNPLGIMKNYLLMIKRAKTKPAEAAKYLEIVGQEIDRVTSIVKEMINFHRPQNVEFKIINVLPVLDGVIEFLSPQLKNKDIEIIKKYSPDCPRVEASADNLKQVFINVIMNSMDAMPDGGKIEIAANKFHDKLQLQICDSGCGVPEEVLPSIFEPFFTTKDESQGTGLGLAVCADIIKKHNGTINFRNRDKGACVEIIIPAAKV